MKKTLNKKLFYYGGLLCLVAVIGLSAIWTAGSSSDGNAGVEQKTETGQNKTGAEGKTDQPESEKKEDQQGGDNSSAPGIPTGQEWKNRISSGRLDSPMMEQSTDSSVRLPYDLPSTTLQIQKLAAYSGVYIEDGSDEEIDGVAAILVKNTGDKDVELAWIDAETSAGSYSFQVTSLPAGASAVVMDRNRTAFSEGEIESLQATATDPAPFELSEDQIEVVSSDGDEIVLKNITDRIIPTIRVFYKFYYPDQNAYVGGITYTAAIQNLGAGETTTIRPSHYSGEAGRIVMIRTYEEEE